MELYKPWALLALAVVLETLGTVLFKHGSNQVETSSQPGWRGHLAGITGALKRKEISLGVLVYIARYIVWLAFISTTALSVAYPLLSLNNILILAASSLFLGEQVGRRRWLGAVLIMGGVFLVGGEA